jgi:hypothetical protein
MGKFASTQKYKIKIYADADLGQTLIIGSPTII